jgi:hypothetical protein
MQNMIKRSWAHINRRKNIKKYLFSKAWASEKCKNQQRPLFTPTVDLSKHVNKTPIHLVTLPFKKVRVTRWGATTVDKKPNIFARLSLKFYIVHKHHQRPREYFYQLILSTRFTSTISYTVCTCTGNLQINSTFPPLHKI